tara:strand:- start:1414 stop:6495 length:5082 start_codon:yes stop_codon:yes gene_type:complete
MPKKILKKNVVGEELQSYVSNQIKRRQKTHGSGVLSSRTTEQLVQLNSTNSWVKLASGVAVTDKKLQDLGIFAGTGLEAFRGMGLAKNHILFGGVSNLTNNGDNYKLNQQNDFIGTYEPEQDFGIVPMPGIKDLTIKALNRGSLKKAIIKIKAQNRNQLNILDALYLRLGYTVLLEWGNSNFLTNEEGRLEKVQDTILENKELFFNEGWQNKAYDDILRKVEEYRVQYQGNYDGMLGKVSNFDWKFNSDGSYDITLTVLSYGDIIESLKTNITAPSSTYTFIDQNSIASQEGTSVNDNRSSNIIFTLLQTFKIVSNLENGKYLTPTVTINKNTPKKIGDFIEPGPETIITGKKEFYYKTIARLKRTLNSKEVTSDELKYYKITPNSSELDKRFKELATADVDAFKTVPWNTVEKLGNKLIVREPNDGWAPAQAIPYNGGNLLRWIVNAGTEEIADKEFEIRAYGFELEESSTLKNDICNPSVPNHTQKFFIPEFEDNFKETVLNKSNLGSPNSLFKKIRRDNVESLLKNKNTIYELNRTEPNQPNNKNKFIYVEDVREEPCGDWNSDLFESYDKFNGVGKELTLDLEKVKEKIRSLTKFRDVKGNIIDIKIKLDRTIRVSGDTIIKDDNVKNKDIFPIQFNPKQKADFRLTDPIINKRVIDIRVKWKKRVTNFEFLNWELPSPGYIGLKSYTDISNSNYNVNDIGKIFYPANFPNLDREDIEYYSLKSLLSKEEKKTYIAVDSEKFKQGKRDNLLVNVKNDFDVIEYPQDFTIQKDNLGDFNIIDENRYFTYPIQNSTLTTNSSPRLKRYKSETTASYPSESNDLRDPKVNYHYQHPYIVWGLSGSTINIDSNGFQIEREKVIFDGLEKGYGGESRGERFTELPIIEKTPFEFTPGRGPAYSSATFNDPAFKDKYNDDFETYKSNQGNILDSYPKPEYDTEGNIVKDGYEFFHRFVGETQEKAKSDKKPFYWDLSFEQEITTLSTGEAENPLKFIEPFDEKGVVVFNTSPRKYYIRFGFLLQLVRDKTLIKIDTKKSDYKDNPPIFDISYQQGISDMLCMPNQMSFDLNKCFVRNDSVKYFKDDKEENYSLFSETYPWDHKNISNPDKYFESVKTNLELFDPDINYTSPVAKGKDKNVADTMNIYLEFDFVGNCMLSSTDERGNMSTYDFVNNICIGLNKALGGVNNLEPVIDEIDNILYVIDSSPKYDSKKLDSSDNQTSDYILQVLGYTSENNIFGVESTFSRKIDLKTAITPEYATMIAVGATAAGYAKGIEATSFATWNKGLIDRFKANFLPPEKPKSGSISEEGSIETFKEEVIQTYQQMMSLDINNNNYNSLAIIPNGNKREFDVSKASENVSIATEYYKFLFGNRAAKEPNKFVGGGTGFIPFKLNITLDGISGFKIYQKLKVDTDFLPDGYAVTTEFIITGVDHVLRDNDWETNLKLIMLPKFEDYKEIVTLDTFRSTAVTYNTETISSQQKNTVKDDSSWADLVVEATECVFNNNPVPTIAFCAKYSTMIAKSIVSKINNGDCNNVTGGWGDANNPNYKDKIESTGKYVLQNSGIIKGPDLATKMVDFFNNSNWEYGDVVQYYLLPNPNSSDPNEVNGYNKYVTDVTQWEAGNGTKVKRNGSAAYHIQVYTGKYSKNNSGTGWTTDKKNNYGTAFVYKSKTYLEGDEYQINVFKVKDNIVNTYN